MKGWDEVAAPAPDAVSADGRVSLARLSRWLVAGPAYPPNAADLRTVGLLGLRLPVRATVAVVR